LSKVFYLFRNITIACFTIIVITSSCNSYTGNKNDDEIVASVYGSNLYFSDIKFPNNGSLNKADSTALAKSYIEHWVRKILLSKHIEKQTDNFERIDRLVEDYKNSLIISEFKKKYIENNLDTTISKQDLTDFYNENKNNFKLENKIISLRYAKIKDKSRSLDKFYENWKKNRVNQVKSYASKHSEDFIIEKDMWYDYDSIKNKIPSFLLKNKDKYKVQLNRKGYEYFLKVDGVKHKNEIVPLILIQNKLKKLIIKKRESDMIDKYIEDLYKKEIESNKVKIYN